MISRFIFIAALAALSLNAAEQKPNIVLFFIDDWAWNGTPIRMDDSMPNSQMPVVSMPNLEKLAREGMKFRNAYASPQCSPSRVCLQTGQSSPRNGFTVYLNSLGQDYYNAKKSKGLPVISCIADETIDPDAVTIPEALAPLGYESAHIGKWHMRGQPSDEGYLVHDGDTNNKPGNTLNAWGGERERKPKRLPDGFSDPKLMFSLTKRALDFMESRATAKQPFYLQISHYAMHAGSECLPETREKYAKHPLVQAWYRENNKDPETVKTGEDPAVWFGMAEDLDGRIGAVLDKLVELGIADNTYVVLMSDNGYRHKEFGLARGLDQPLHAHKWWVWQGGIRVPMIVRGPGIKAGSSFEENVVNYDLLPTFVDWAGGNPAGLREIDGVSLAGYLNGEKKADPEFRKRFLYFHYPHNRTSMPHSAIVSGTDKVIHFYEKPDLPMLFDLANDEAETTNIAPGHPERHRELFDEMFRYFKEVGARIPKLNPDFDEEAEAAWRASDQYQKTASNGPFIGRRELQKDEKASESKKVSAVDSKPNVLFLAVDDMNDWIGCLAGSRPGEGPRALTPNFDKLAARGVNFTNAHTAGVFCAPSRAAIFSGQFASTTGCYESANYFVNRPEIESLQTSFAKAGYTTLGTGKLYHHPVGAIDQRGWTEFFLRTRAQRENGWALDSWSEGTPFPKPFPASIYNEGQRVTGGLFLEWAGLPNEREEEMADTIRVNWAVEQLQKKHDQPFFLACGIYAPHYPHYCPQTYYDLYDRDKIELPRYKADDLDDLPPKIAKAMANRLRIRQKLESLDALDDAIHGYLACISYADAMMGRVLDALEASPYADNTIVVLWSDHGYHLGEKQWGKHTLWERTSNVPFLWAGPGVTKGAKTDVTVSLIDMYPTLVEMCGLPKPRQPLEGESLATTLKTPEQAGDRNVLLPDMRPGNFAVINRDWRYIRYGEDGEELYDLQADPHEWNNLAKDPEHAARMVQMRQFAPDTWAEPEPRLNSRKDLVIEGETFRWEKGAGNYKAAPIQLPYTNPPALEKAESKLKPGANLIRNGSFEEEGGHSWQFEKGAYEIDSNQKPDGKRSLRSKKGLPRGKSARQRVAIEPSTEFEVSYRIYFAPGSEGRVVFDTLDRFDDTAQVVMDASQGGEWLRFSKRFHSGEHKDVTLRFFPGQGFHGQFFVDEVQLRALSAKTKIEK